MVCHLKMMHKFNPLCEIPLIHSFRGTIQLQAAALPLQSCSPTCCRCILCHAGHQATFWLPQLTACAMLCSLHTHPLIQQAKGHQPRNAAATHARNVQQPSNYLAGRGGRKHNGMSTCVHSCCMSADLGQWWELTHTSLHTGVTPIVSKN